MQSSYNVISNIIIDEGNPKFIETEYVRKLTKEEAKKVDKEPSEQEIYRRYETVAQKLIDNAKEKRDSIIADAYKNAVEIENNSFDKGYKAGYDEGVIKGNDDGYKDSYEKNIEPAKKQAEKIIESAEKKVEIADNYLIDSKKQYSAYLDEKKNDIKNVIIAICENILKNELSEPSLIDNMIFDVISNIKNTKTFLIRCNNKYIEEVKGKIDEWKNALSFDTDIFAVCDENVEDGSAVIVKDNGKVVVGIQEGISKIKDKLYGDS